MVEQRERTVLCRTFARMTLGQAYDQLVQGLQRHYDLRESRQIAREVFVRLTGYTPSLRLLHKTEALSSGQQKRLAQMQQQLLQSVPLQYVLQEAWFMGWPFYVDPAVLIPRPETEELAEWILEKTAGTKRLRVLDIGTGSGCLAIALKKQRPDWVVWGLDKYPEALAVARKNASALAAPVEWIVADVLDGEGCAGALPQMDLIVSNPPYIPLAEKKTMAPHVAGQEPDTALFVPDAAPLLFYEAICRLALKKLSPDGLLFFEIHEGQGPGVTNLLQSCFSEVVQKTDLSGKDRMRCARGRKDKMG